MTAETPLLRPHAEQLYADELAALERADDRPRPPRWRLSPWAVTTYLLGGEADGVDDHARSTSAGAGWSSSPSPRSRPTARCSCSACPGTAKTWLSEHLAAAISGDSTLLVQGTAGTPEEALRYGWNYARLLAEGPSPRRARRRPGVPRDAGRASSPASRSSRASRPTSRTR